jgi:FkbM family methyltransferase
MGFTLMRQFVRPGDRVVDIGANLGVYTFELARLVGPRGSVLAVEPDPVSVARLTRLARGLPQVKISPVAASDRSGRATLHVPVIQRRRLGRLRTMRLGALGSLALPREAAAPAYESVSVPTEPLDAILAESELPVAFMKIDVEGHELAVLRGARATLANHLPTLLIEIEQRHSQGDIAVTFDFLRTSGYIGYGVGPRGLVPLDRFDLRRDQLSFLGSGFVSVEMPRDYIHDFLFVRPGTNVDRPNHDRPPP